MEIPLLAEREDDKKIASLLSMKLTSSKSVLENTDLIRKRILCESSLPTSSFSRTKEIKAVKLLGKRKNNLGIVSHKITKTNNIEEIKKVRLTSLVEDYGSSSGSE